MIGTFLYIFFATAVGESASNAGRSFLFWLFMGMVLTPLIAWIILFMLGDK